MPGDELRPFIRIDGGRGTAFGRFSMNFFPGPRKGGGVDDDLKESARTEHRELGLSVVVVSGSCESG